MPVNLKCKCGAVLTLDVNHIGKVAKCGKCGKQFRVPESLRPRMEAARRADETRPAATPPAPAAPAEPAEDTGGLSLADDEGEAREVDCPNCGKRLPAEAVICIDCGHNMQTGGAPSEAQATMTPADARMAAAKQESEQGGGGDAYDEGRTSIAAYKHGRLNGLLDKVGGGKVVGIVLAVIVVGVGGFLAFRHFAGGEAEPPAQQQPPGPAPSPDTAGPTPDAPDRPAPDQPKPRRSAPTFEGFANAASRATVRLRALHAALAQYVQANGTWPTSLNDLPDGAEAPEAYTYVGAEIAALERHRLLAHERAPSGPNNTTMALFSDGAVRALTPRQIDDRMLRKAHGAYLTRAETALLNALRPRVRVVNHRFATLAVAVDGNNAGQAAFGEALDLTLAPGTHKVAFTARGETTEPIELALNNATVYHLEARPHSELPPVYLEAYQYYMQPKPYRRGKVPDGPEYEATFAPGSGGAARALVLKSEAETVRALFTTQTDGEGGPAAINVDAEKGLLGATILRDEIEYAGLNGRPIKVNAYHRLAEGRERHPNGEVVVYHETALGTFASSEKANLLPAALLGYGLPEDRAALPQEGYVDVDALMPLLRKVGRPAVSELQRALSAGPSQPIARAETADEAGEQTAPTLPPSVGREGGYDAGYGGQERRFLGPWTRGKEQPGGYGVPDAREEERRLRRMEARGAPEQKEGEAARVPTAFERAIVTLGFYLSPAEIGVLTAVISKTDDAHQRRAAALALGRIGSPLAIDDITNRREWEGGPPTEDMPKARRDTGQAPGEPGMHDEPPPEYYDPGMQQRTRLTVPPEHMLAPLAMIDASAMPLPADAAQAPPGRRALALLTRRAAVSGVTTVVADWPRGAGAFSARNFVLGLKLSYNNALADMGLLNACYALDPAATAELCRAMVETDAPEKLPFYRILCRALDRQAIAALAAETGNAQQAHRAAVALAETGDAALIGQVKAAAEAVLASGPADQKAAVLAAWARLNRTAGEDMAAAATLLHAQLNAEAAEVRLAAVHGLDLLADRAGVAVLRPAVEAASPDVQRAAVAALGDHKADQALPLLRAALKSDHTEVLAAVARQAVATNAAPLKDELKALYSRHVANEQAAEFVESAAGAIARFDGAESAVTLRPGLFHPVPEVRAAVARILGSVKGDAATQDLFRLLNDDDTVVRVAAVEALGNSGRTRAYRELAQMAFPAEGGYTDASWPALKALVRSKDPRAYEALRGVLGQQDIWKFWSVVYAARTQLPPGERTACIRFLCTYLKAEHKPLRVLVAHGLAELGAGEAARDAFLSRDLDTSEMLASKARVLANAGHEEDILVLDRHLRGFARSQARGGRDNRPYEDPGMGERRRKSPVVALIRAIGAIDGARAAGSLGRYMLNAQNDDELAAMITALSRIETDEAVKVLAALYRRLESDELKLQALAAAGEIGHTNARWAERTLFEDALRSGNPKIMAGVGDALDAIARHGGPVVEPEA